MGQSLSLGLQSLTGEVASGNKGDGVGEGLSRTHSPASGASVSPERKAEHRSTSSEGSGGNA